MQAWGGAGSGLRLAEQRARPLRRPQQDPSGSPATTTTTPWPRNFTREGKFVKQIGKAGSQSEGSKTEGYLGQPFDRHRSTRRYELFVADGYGNKRIAVFDCATGEYRRHWGAYGGEAERCDKQNAPEDPSSPRKTFANPVHCVRISHDGLVYVCDRVNNRVQVFRKNGTFVTEYRPRHEHALRPGSVWDIGFSTDPGAEISLRHRRHPTTRSISCCARTAKRSRRLWQAGPQTPASSTGCTRWRSIPAATSIPATSIPASGRRSSCARREPKSGAGPAAAAAHALRSNSTWTKSPR